MINLVCRHFEKKITDDVADVLSSGWLAMGPKTEQLEKKLAELIGVKYCIATSSCTAALFLVLTSKIKYGDHVIVSPNTFASVISAILMANGIPVFVDIDLRTGNINPACLTTELLDKSRAIIISHYAGIPSQRSVIEIARKHGLLVIDDSAHALGARYADCSTIQKQSDVACFSFNSTKLFSCGEGGAIVTNKSSLAHQCCLRRNYGMTKTSFEKRSEDPSFDIQYLSLNFKFNDILAAVLLPQLDPHYISHIVKKRNAITKEYKRLLGNIDVEFVWPLENDQPSWLFLPILLPESLTLLRNQVVSMMRDKGVEVGIHYPVVSELRFLNGMSFVDAKYLVARDFSSRVLTLPCHEGMIKADVETVVNAIKEVLEEIST